MTSTEIRKKFLTFFESRNHRIVRSSSLVPANDPTLLFSNAGMNQFKDVFLGAEKRDYTRACSSQKCVRAGGKHNDLEQVGRTTRHHTFFEMLGNFSFGDYFKKEAIPWAWELVTKEFAIPGDKLYATVFREDDEAEDLWAKIVPRDRIFRMDEKDNFWAMGDTGPCGPCSEIHYDLGPAASEQGHTDCKFPCDCGRYVELWNLVFMQYDRVSIGKQADPNADFADADFVETAVRLLPLPRPSIDTGAGLERMAAVLQGKLSNFDTDLFRPLIEEAAELAKVEYGTNHESDISLRIIADHSRAATFLISDAVVPDKGKRGSVLRKIIRRALRHGRMLGIGDAFLYKMSVKVASLMSEPYPDLLQSASRIARIIRHEEEKFDRTLTLGLRHLNSEIRIAAQKSFKETGQPVQLQEWKDGTLQVKDEKPLVIPGWAAFQLYDTLGVPLDIVEEEGSWRHFAVDREGYEAAMERQRERGRASWKAVGVGIAPSKYLELALLDEGGKFEGYNKTKIPNSRIVALVVKGVSAPEVTPGAEVEIVLDHTPFYAEAGGQVGDTGFLAEPESGRHIASVTDTYRPVAGVIAHKAISHEVLRVEDIVSTVVDATRRDAVRRNHTATHLLHAALRYELGTHVKQAGSLVAPDRLRFDFSHYAALGEQDVLDIEDLVNQHVLANEEMHTEVMDLDSAINTGAMALFGEKYGDKVRVVKVGDGSYSKELCGGTHVHRTGDIGLFKVVSEGSVAAGTRRIEALTGEGVLEQLRKTTGTLALLSETLRAKPDELLQAAEKLAESEKKLRKQLEAQQLKQATSQAGDLLESAMEVKGVRVISHRVEVNDRGAMRQMVDNLRPRLNSGVIVLGSAAEGKVSLIVAVTKDLTDRLDAGKIVKAAAALVGGGGGGRKDLAEAGGTQPEKLDEALNAIPSIIEQML
jgi:alanyl-tRNA synthetase